MNLKYVKYFKCYCSSTKFSAYCYENAELTCVHPSKYQETIIYDGLIRCDMCHRCFPVSESILNALPNTITEFNCPELKEACCKKIKIKCRAGLAVKRSSDQTSVTKIREIKARNEQTKIYHTYGYELHGKNEQRVFRNFLRFNEKDVVLELGCGTGRISQEVIVNGFHEYIAIDFSYESLRLFMSKLDDSTKNRVCFIMGDVCSLPLFSQIADKVISAQVLEHIPGKGEQQRFVDELHRLLKQGGSAAITAYNYNIKKRLDKDLAKQGFHNREIYYENFTTRELRSLFSPYFKIITLKGINCHYPFARRMTAATQRQIESILSSTPISDYLGDILFAGFTTKS